MSGTYYLTIGLRVIKTEFYSKEKAQEEAGKFDIYKSIIHVDENGVVTTVWTRPKPLVKYYVKYQVRQGDKDSLKSFNRRRDAVAWLSVRNEYYYSTIIKLMEV